MLGLPGGTVLENSSISAGILPFSGILLENSMDRGAWRATDNGVINSQTRLSD